MDKLRSCSARSPGNQPNGPHSFQVDDTPYFVYRVVENIFACRGLGPDISLFLSIGLVERLLGIRLARCDVKYNAVRIQR